MSTDRSKPSSGTQIAGSGGAVQQEPSASSSMPAAEAPSLVGEVLDGRYRITKKIGEGGMGEVYAAEHVHIEKHVAVKLLKAEIVSNKEAVSRFRQEARSASSIGHKNIIGIDDFGSLPDGRIYLCMELLNGQALNDLIQQPMPPERLLNIMIQTGHGLAAAHAKGITHRDMKPENIFVTFGPQGEDIPKLLDFGIAKVAGHDGQNNLTRTGTIFGTPFYMAPEQALGQQIDARVDIYAMGVILYELFAGSLPFRGESFMGILTQHITTEPEPVVQRAMKAGRTLPPGLAEVISKAMAKEPDKRYRTMDELTNALVEVYRVVAGAGMSTYMQAYQGGASGMMPVPGTPPTGMHHAAGSQPYQVPGMSQGVHPAPTPGPMMPPMQHGMQPGMQPGMQGMQPQPGSGQYGGYMGTDSSSVALPKKGGKTGLIFAIIAVLAIAAGITVFVLVSNKDDSGGSGAGTASGSGSGSQIASGSGSASGSAHGSGAGTASGSSGGSQVASGSGHGSQVASGSDSGSANGSGSGAGTGSQAASGSDSGSANGSGSGSQVASGSDSGTGSGAGTGSGVIAPAPIEVEITSNVPGAIVYDGKKALGPAPQTIKIIDEQPVSVTVKAKGWKDKTQKIDGTTDTVAFALTKITGGGGHGSGSGNGSGSSSNTDDARKKLCKEHPDDVRCMTD
jgi:tRNA A-37 threonylcarbamoyl transferase component Bud32